MAEVRCPMCSKANPEEAEVCEFCGARLKPLVGDSGAEAEFDRGDAGSEEGVPDWLARIRERAEEEIPEEPAPAADEPVEEEEQLDWLGRLRSAEAPEEGPPEGEVPEWVAAEAGGDAEPPAEEPDAEAEPQAEGEPEPQSDWLQQLREGAEEKAALEEDEAIASEAEPPAGAPDAPETPAEERETRQPPRTGELPGWLSDTSVDLDAMQGPPGESADQPQQAGDPQAEPPDWFDAFERAGDEDAAPPDQPSVDSPLESEPGAEPPADEGDVPDWLSDVEAPPTEAEPAAPAFRDEEEPWVPEEPPLEGAPVPDQPAPASGADAEAPDLEDFDWEEESLEAEEPDKAEPEEDLPHVPALITDGEAAPRFEETDDFDLDAIELPDWLADAQAGQEEGPELAGEGDLAPATIPSWLEAMRPVETFRPVVDAGPEEEEVVESVGPLAGLRGVLLAEPVVAKPRTDTATGARLQVTERQYAQAELLQRIVDEEEHERTFAPRGGRRLPLIRWLVSLVLLVVLLLPPLTGLPQFALPERVSRDLGPLVERVNQLPADRPVLVVFDYEPGYTAELEGVSGTLLEHLFARNVNVVTLSTRPTGPPLALDLVTKIGQPHAAENGRSYVHLGYLSGGPAAVQLFAAAPRQSILKGFMPPADLPAVNPWQGPILRDVDQLADFGMVAVVSSGTDNAKTWAEQAHPYLGDTPLIMVLSAGAEPLIRPYFEAMDPQVDGILTGLRSAVAYEQINGRPGPAHSRWDAFGTGVLAVEVVLLAGTVYGVASWVLSRRRE